MRIALVSRELYPLWGGGVAQFVSAAATLLAQDAEVTVLTTSRLEQTYRALVAAGDERLPPAGVRVEFVSEPTDDEAAPWSHPIHLYSSRVYAKLRELYPDRPPDVIEFPDFLGEGFVTLQAKEALDPFLAQTTICVRLHTSAEVCQVLDGYCPRDFWTGALHAMERYALRHADRVIWQGGDILSTYTRFYGDAGIAPRRARIRYPYRGRQSPAPPSAASKEERLRILYIGRLERRKGVAALVRAATGLRRDDFRLTLLGGDTPTAPLGASMQGLLAMAIADDDRIVLGGNADRDAVLAAVREHDVVVVSSLWECWPYAALEALHLNRPLLATPVGGLVELVQPAKSGWLTAGTDAAALADGLEALLDSRSEIAELSRRGAPNAHARQLADDHEIRDAYQELVRGAERVSPARRASRRPPLVSAIVPYYRASRFINETIDSLVAQTYPRIEIVVVNDGSFEEDDWILAEIATREPVVVVSQMNAGLGAARNFGVLQSTGRYFFPLDADNAADPEFVSRCVEILESRPQIAYVTSWSRYIDEKGDERDGNDVGYQPLGNHAAVNDRQNVAGDAASLVRRRIFDAGLRYSEELTSFEDWHFYRELQRAGHLGAVIPERLLRYRLREDSMQARIARPNRERLLGEIDALIRENAIRWTSSSV